MFFPKKILYYCTLFILTCTVVINFIPAIAIESANVRVEQRLSSSSLTQGIESYQQGQFSQAVELWRQVAQTYQQKGDLLNQALTLNYLSLAYQALGQWSEAENAIATSLDLLKSTSDPKAVGIQAKVYNTQGSLYLAQGRTQLALKSWQQAEQIYAQLDDQTGVLGSQINQSQALQNLGFYLRAKKILAQVNQQLQNQPDSSLKATGLRSLGVALQKVGDVDQAQNLLEQSLALSNDLADSGNVSLTLFSLGNLAQSLNQTETALNYYQQVAQQAPNQLSKLEAQINQITLLLQSGQTSTAQQLYQEIKPSLLQLTPSRRAIYSQIHLAHALIKSQANLPNLSEEILALLEQSIEQANSLKDTRAKSYALGTLGLFYEQQNQWQEAQKLTQEALNLALSINADDIAYQWQWQLGRIAEQQGNLAEAIAVETVAVKTLQGLRNDLVAMNPDVQFSFQESVEPLYRDLARLLLTPEQNTREISQKNLQQARDVLESLQVAELENFFREACLKTQEKRVEEIDQNAAVIYSLILADRLALIVSFPDQTLSYYETRLPQGQIEGTLEELLQSLNPAFSDRLRLQLSQQVYDWMVKPIESQLAQQDIQTLVFVLDGMLRNLPMAALYDGQQYLIEKYQVALAPSLQLTDPQAIASQDIRAVLAGVSEQNQGFQALPGVETEISEIATEIPSSQLLNENFTQSRFREQIGETPAPVIHLATHGQFSSNPEDTFVLAWEDTIRVKDFQLLLRSREEQGPIPVELLVLSACQTAEGDKKAALGLAGMAVRSGARSTIATLWAVKDESTAELMTEFYRELAKNQTSTTKAEALRQAQLELIKSAEFAHPFYWAPFVLVGNWT